MSYKSTMMPTYAAYGGVPQEQAYGGVPASNAPKGAVPTEAAYGGIPLYQAGQNKQISSTVPDISKTIPKAKNIYNWSNKITDILEAGTVGYTSGAALGNFDEIMGGVTALGTLKHQNYQMGRDAVRKIQDELKQKHPFIYNAAETIGTVNSPVKIFRSAKTAPLARHNANRWYNSFVDAVIAAGGYSDSLMPYDFLKNLATFGAGNAIGNVSGNRMLGRGSGNAGRMLYDAFGNSTANILTDWLENESEAPE